MKRILFLTQGDVQVASSRHRVYLYLPALAKAGFETVVQPAVLANEFKDTFFNRSLNALMLRGFRTFTRRVKNLHDLKDFDFVFVQKPVLPAPFFDMEWRFSRQTRLIFDFDDAVFLKRPGGSLVTNWWPQERRVASICRCAQQVVVGNNFLKEFVQKNHVEPVVLPTCVDTQAFAAQFDLQKRPRKIPVIGWVGSLSTQKDLQLATPALLDLHSRTPFVVRLIGATHTAMPHRFPIEWKPWDLQTEVADIASLDIGLAPMHDTPWNRGKCGLKVLQYWAAGVPVVASPVGIYREIIRDGENGFLAASRQEWTEKLFLLIKQPELRQRLIGEGRKTVEEHFSLKKLAPRFVQLFEERPSNEESKDREKKAE
jgi:glycosyltransferase involved in cell wall biosynthesis